eukprot:g73353.t1
MQEHDRATFRSNYKNQVAKQLAKVEGILHAPKIRICKTNRPVHSMLFATGGGFRRSMTSRQGYESLDTEEGVALQQKQSPKNTEFVCTLKHIAVLVLSACILLAALSFSVGMNSGVAMITKKIPSVEKPKDAEKKAGKKDTTDANQNQNGGAIVSSSAYGSLQGQAQSNTQSPEQVSCMFSGSSQCAFLAFQLDIKYNRSAAQARGGLDFVLNCDAKQNSYSAETFCMQQGFLVTGIPLDSDTQFCSVTQTGMIHVLFELRFAHKACLDFPVVGRLLLVDGGRSKLQTLTLSSDKPPNFVVEGTFGPQHTCTVKNGIVDLSALTPFCTGSAAGNITRPTNTTTRAFESVENGGSGSVIGGGGDNRNGNERQRDGDRTEDGERRDNAAGNKGQGGGNSGGNNGGGNNGREGRVGNGGEQFNGVSENNIYYDTGNVNMRTAGISSQPQPRSDFGSGRAEV